MNAQIAQHFIVHRKTSDSIQTKICFHFKLITVDCFLILRHLGV